jgi:GT2 family glycosyltransferase
MPGSRPDASGLAPEVSIVITSRERRDALVATLEALARQTVPTGRYEVLVTDDGSTDGTFEAARSLSVPYALRVLRHERQRGVSAGRNTAIREARGRVLIFLSDDLLVPEGFVARHLEVLERHPGCWVVGGFRQLPSLRETPFGRYLDDLEEGFTAARKQSPVGPELWELGWPTARNLSLPRADFDAVGPFDERFRSTCEDQDLAERARAHGIRFLYDASIDCLHNDQAGDLLRCCRAQRRGTHDTALFCAKHAERHGRSPFARANGPWTPGDGVGLGLRKAAKVLLSSAPVLGALERSVPLLEKAGLPERHLRRVYRGLIGLHTFRGWREGLATLARGPAA